MLIGIDASRANRKFKGGTEWYSFYLIKELARLDKTNQYILYTDKPLTAELCDLTNDQATVAGRIDKSGYQTIISPYNNFKAKILNWPFTYFWTQIRLSLEMLGCPPDVLFVPAHTLPVIHPRKSVVTIHDVGFAREEGLYSDDKIGPNGATAGLIVNLAAKILTKGKFSSNILDYHRWSTKFALKYAKKIIAVSKFTRNEILDIYRAKADKIEVVYNGFNEKIYKLISDKTAINKICAKYGINEPYIFYVGRLEKKKNTPRLLMAYNIMRDKYGVRHKLVLAGNASLGFDEVKYIIEEFDLNNQVSITGWIPEADLPYLLNGASLFVFPSLYEGFGIPLLEAMACGAPVAASAIASIREVADNAAVYFNPQSKHDMAKKISQVLADKKLSEELINRGLARVKNFSLAKCARETLAVLENLK